MVTVASDNPFPSILMVEGDPEALAANPASGQRRLAVGTDHLLYLVDETGTKTAVAAGAVAADAIWDAAGDLVQGTGANTAARLALGAEGTVLRSTGSTNAYAYPPGYEFDYAEITSAASPTATAEASANTVVSGNAVTYDGSTAVIIEFFASEARADLSNAAILLFWLFDGSSSIGRIGRKQSDPDGGGVLTPILCRRKLTPSAASHTYSIRATVSTGTGNVNAGAGGTGNAMPAYIRITKA